MTTTFTNYLEHKGQTLADMSNEDIYVALLHFVKELAEKKTKNQQKNNKFKLYLKTNKLNKYIQNISSKNHKIHILFNNA